MTHRSRGAGAAPDRMTAPGGPLHGFDLDRRLLRCVECADVASVRAAGWRLALDCDGELVAFCQECWASEFEDG